MDTHLWKVWMNDWFAFAYGLITKWWLMQVFWNACFIVMTLSCIEESLLADMWLYMIFKGLPDWPFIGHKHIGPILNPSPSEINWFDNFVYFESKLLLRFAMLLISLMWHILTVIWDKLSYRFRQYDISKPKTGKGLFFFLSWCISSLWGGRRHNCSNCYAQAFMDTINSLHSKPLCT